MDKEIRAQRVAAKLHAVERSIDDTLALAAELMVEMRGACVDLNLSAQVSDGSFAKLVEAMGQMQAARTNVVGSHKRMDNIREALGLRTVATAGLKNYSALDEEPVSASASVARLHG
jgi:hypothetical protein